MRSLSPAVAFGILLTWATAWGDVYYVDPGGSDDDPGTESRPFLTIGKASQVLQPGDTVYIKAGTYREVIRPARSGEEDRPITYARHADDEVVITGVYDAVDLTNRHYVVLDGLKILEVGHYWVNMRGEDSFHSATHNVIQNCHMEGSNGGWAGVYMQYGVEYTRLLNNTFMATCDDASGVGGPHDLVQCSGGCRNNLIEGNRFSYGCHQLLALRSTAGPTTHNVVRNNFFTNPWHTGVELAGDGVTRNLVAGNLIVDCGDEYREDGQFNFYGSDRDRFEFDRKGHKSIQINSSGNIFRRNVLINNGGISMNSWSDRACLNNRLCHNTHYLEYYGVHTNTGNPMYGNTIKNDIFFQSRDYAIWRELSHEQRENYYVNNNMLGGDFRYKTDESDVVTLDYLQSNYPEFWYDNIALPPQFTDEQNRDLQLVPTSPMIDAGAFLTSITASGSGLQIPVQDASYFTDGFGITEGDRIQLEGQAQTLVIESIAGDVITVDRSISWTEGDGVGLAYGGSAPDIGAYEHQEEARCGDGTCDAGECDTCPSDCGPEDCPGDDGGLDGGGEPEDVGVTAEGGDPADAAPPDGGQVDGGEVSGGCGCTHSPAASIGLAFCLLGLAALRFGGEGRTRAK